MSNVPVDRRFEGLLERGLVPAQAEVGEVMEKTAKQRFAVLSILSGVEEVRVPEGVHRAVRTELLVGVPNVQRQKLPIHAWDNYYEETGGIVTPTRAPAAMPPANDEAKQIIARWAQQIEIAQQLPLDELYQRAYERTKKKRRKLVAPTNTEMFGHYLVMESLGHGVAWADSREPHGLEGMLPDLETLDVDLGFDREER